MKKNKHNYVFPNFMAEAMTKLSSQVQMEATMMSMLVILIGLLFGAGYTLFFTSASLLVKIMVGVNAIAGFTMLTSYLVTAFIQYKTYMVAVHGDAAFEDFKIIKEDKEENKKDDDE
jgi:hypothetical protein